MAESLQIVALSGGKLNVFTQGEKGPEAILALPLNRLIVKMVKVPAENAADPSAYALPILQAMSPYPDEPLTVSCETVATREDGSLTVIAAALPEGSTDDLGEGLDETKLSISRVDVLALGAIRSIWSKIDDGRDLRRLVLIGSEDCISMFVLDKDEPVSIRAASPSADLKREALLSLLEAEDFGGSKPLGEIVIAGEVAAEGLDAIAPIRKLEESPDAMPGMFERAVEQGSIDALPDSWREVLAENRLKSKIIKGLVWAGTIWLLILGAMFSEPLVYGWMKDHQHELRNEHKERYEAVKNQRDAVQRVRKYSNHNRGALEMLLVASNTLPEGAELSSWSFKCDSIEDYEMSFTGEAASSQNIYAFMDKLRALGSSAADGNDDDKVFDQVELKSEGPGGRGRRRFTIVCYHYGDAGGES